MILSGEKKEEYRELKAYWITRLIKINNPEEARGENKVIPHNIAYDLESHEPAGVLRSYYSEFKKFDYVEFRNGYQKNARSMMFKCEGITIGRPKPGWCGYGIKNMKGNVFIIKLGINIYVPDETH